MMAAVTVAAMPVADMPMSPVTAMSMSPVADMPVPVTYEPAEMVMAAAEVKANGRVIAAIAAIPTVVARPIGIVRVA